MLLINITKSPEASLIGCLTLISSSFFSTTLSRGDLNTFEFLACLLLLLLLLRRDYIRGVNFASYPLYLSIILLIFTIKLSVPVILIILMPVLYLSFLFLKRAGIMEDKQKCDGNSKGFYRICIRLRIIIFLIFISLILFFSLVYKVDTRIFLQSNFIPSVIIISGMLRGYSERHFHLFILLSYFLISTFYPETSILIFLEISILTGIGAGEIFDDIERDGRLLKNLVIYSFSLWIMMFFIYLITGFISSDDILGALYCNIAISLFYILKKATILIRHKIYFATAGIALSIIIGLILNL